MGLVSTARHHSPSQSWNPTDSIAAKYLLEDRLGQVQAIHLLAFHAKSLAGGQEFPVSSGAGSKTKK